MKRRETLRTLLVGTIGSAALFTASSCEPNASDVEAGANDAENGLYGRTPEEIEHDEEVNAEEYLNDHELASIAVLCDIILPATAEAGSATDAKVPEFIDFIVKDLPDLQLPIRGGLMWLNYEANRRFRKDFITCLPEEELQIIEDIAYPDPEELRPDMAYGITFFDLLRNLTLTGYYTTKMGLDDLGYTGNFANVWDGVPAEVLADHDVDYDDEWLAKCVDQNERMTIAEWDADGNLLT